MGVGRGALEEEGGKKRYQDAACQGVAAAAGQGRAEEAQVEALGSAPELLLHGCEVSRLLQDHHGVFPRADSRCLLGMFHRALPVHWGSGKANGRMLLQKEESKVNFSGEISLREERNKFRMRSG